MKQADLHCHSIYSEHPTEWFLQKLGAKESYTEPEFIFREAKRRGMDFVSITDHNRIDGALKLKELYPSDVIVGVEATTYFPEDMCKIHVLMYGIDELHFEVINHIRKDIYELRDYLQKEDIAHSVAHASYSVNGKLSIPHLEKLVLLFDHFETINGGRNKQSNLGWKNILDNLNADNMHDIYRKHRIEPFSQQPWIKGYTGGSDDHAGLFIGQSYTMAKARDVNSFLDCIKTKQSTAVGRHNDYHALAFTVYKIAYDFSKQHHDKRRKNSMLSAITENLFDNRNLDVRSKIKARTLKGLADLQGNELKLRLSELIDTLQDNGCDLPDGKLDKVYTHISDIADAFFKILLNSLEEDVKDLNFVKLIRNVSVSLPGIFLLIPFFSSLRHMHQTHSLITGFRTRHHIHGEHRKRKTLWFTDTINDLNGVSVTLKQMGKIAEQRGREIMLVASLSDNEITNEIPENMLNLPSMYAFKMPYYDNYNLKTPSILKSLKLINDFEPDQIIISTPGPIGLLGLVAAKLLGIPVTGIYHTDFCGEAMHIVRDESAAKLVLEYERWFYNQMNEIRTPTNEYKRILVERDITVYNMKLLKRGIELNHFAPLSDRKRFFNNREAMKQGVTLLYAGRVSQDKSLSILVQLYKEVVQEHPELNLVIAGNGPYLSEMKAELSSYTGVLFTGAIPRNQLPELYNAADYFVFPSVTDTFGMVILESQACGLPVIVSAYGGPQEMVAHGQNGFIVENQELESWLRCLKTALSIYADQPDKYEQMRVNSRVSTADNGDWDTILDDLLGTDMME